MKRYKGTKKYGKQKFYTRLGRGLNCFNRLGLFGSRGVLGSHGVRCVRWLRGGLRTRPLSTALLRFSRG